MANRIAGNTYIIDSALNTVALPWPSGARIKAINFLALNSSGSLTLSASDTSDTFVRIVHPANNNAAQTLNFVMNGASFDHMHVPVCTAGTAWIYFG